MKHIYHNKFMSVILRPSLISHLVIVIQCFFGIIDGLIGIITLGTVITGFRMKFSGWCIKQQFKKIVKDLQK